MTREEQKINRELKKRLPKEIRKLNKKYKLQYAHEFLYRFEGDFLYIGMPHISIENGHLFNSVEISPWVLNEVYWRVQQFNMEEKKLKTIDCIKDDLEGYKISDLNRALVYIKQEEYEKALFVLQNGDRDDGIIHMDMKGKTAREYAIDFCLDATEDIN